MDESYPELQSVPVEAPSPSHFLPFSKAGAVFVEPETISPVANPPSPDTPGDAAVIMSGSKSLMVIPPDGPPVNDVVNAESPGEHAKSQ